MTYFDLFRIFRIFKEILLPDLGLIFFYFPMLIFVKTDIFTDIHYPSFSLKDTFWATKNELFKIKFLKYH